MQVDHVDPEGGDDLDNLCLPCWNCNNHKRQATHAIDPETGEDVPLFNPRKQAWSEHFEWLGDATHVRGLTPTGRATIVRLKMNRPAIVVACSRWVEGGVSSTEARCIAYCIHDGPKQSLWVGDSMMRQAESTMSILKVDRD